MTPRIKRLLVLPLVVALYFVHPVLGFIGLAGGFVVVLRTRHARDGATSIVR